MTISKKSKILFIITKSNWGGAQRYVFDLATDLPKDQFEVVVAAGGAGTLVQKLTAAGIRTISLPSLERDIHVGKEFRAFRDIRTLIQTEQPGVVHLNSSKVGALGALAARSLRATPKTIFTAHGWAFFEKRALPTRAVIYGISWLTALLSHHVITITHRGTRAARAMPFVAHKKIYHIPLGIATTTPHLTHKRPHARHLLERAIGKKLDAPIIGTIAELTHNKGLDTLIAACKTLAQVNNPPSIVIIGEGEQRARIEGTIAAAGLEAHVHLAGFIPDAHEYLPGFDVFVLPSRKEGLPYTIMEAMHAGVAIAATHVGGIPDMIQHNQNGLLVPPENSLALARALATLAQDHMLRKSFADESKKKVATRFAFHDMMQKTIQLYAL